MEKIMEKCPFCNGIPTRENAVCKYCKGTGEIDYEASIKKAEKYWNSEENKVKLSYEINPLESN